MEFKSKELLEATEKPSSVTVVANEVANKAVLLNELRKYFLLIPGKSNVFYDIGTLVGGKEVNPVINIVNALEQHYAQLAKEKNDGINIEHVNAIMAAIVANIKLLQQIDSKLEIKDYSNIVALIGGIFSKLL